MRSLFLLLLLTANCQLLPVASAQELLTLDEAIARSLQHNYDIRIVGNAAQQSAANNTPGNAGFLPNVTGNANANIINNNTHLRFITDTVVDRSGANTFSISAGISASYTVFAAGRAWLVKKQLGQQEKISDIQLKAQMQNTVSQVIQAYALVVNSQQQLVATDTAIALAKARMDLSRSKYDIGTSAKVDYLQGRVDYNASRSQLLAQDVALVTARTSLNLLMGEDANRSYAVEDSLTLNLSLQPSDKNVLEDQNLSLETARRNAEMYRTMAHIARTYYYPSLTLTGGYAYTRTQSDAGTYILNRGYGPTGGLGLSVPIFQGGNIRRQVKVANLQALGEDLIYERQSLQLGGQYQTAWKSYQNAVAGYKLEQESITYAKENLGIQEARFRVGVATSLEIREAENSYVTALARLYTAAYNVKVNETKVLELESSLV